MTNTKRTTEARRELVSINIMVEKIRAHFKRYHYTRRRALRVAATDLGYQLALRQTELEDRITARSSAP